MIPTNIQLTPITATALLGLMEAGQSGPISSYTVTNDSDVAVSALATITKLQNEGRKTRFNDLPTAIECLDVQTSLLTLMPEFRKKYGSTMEGFRGDTRTIAKVNLAAFVVKTIHQKMLEEVAAQTGREPVTAPLPPESMLDAAGEVRAIPQD